MVTDNYIIVLKYDLKVGHKGNICSVFLFIAFLSYTVDQQTKQYEWWCIILSGYYMEVMAQHVNS